jgi:glycosyltransferase involved in cell wall biosynthesis
MSVFNDVARVERAVRSILGQSLQDLELIVIDDGSSDGSGPLLDRLANADVRMRVIAQSNQGLTRSLIRGCEQARAAYIARQDSDDWSAPDRLMQQAAMLDGDARVGFVSCATRYVGPADEGLSVETRAVDPEIATAQMFSLRQGPPAHGSVMFRRNLYERVGGYRDEFQFAQDSDLWLRMAEVALVGSVPTIGYVHRKDIGGTSGARRALQLRFADLGHGCREARLRGESEAKWLDQARDLSARVRSGLESERDSGAALASAYLLGSQLACNGDARARPYLFRVIRANPLHWKAWIRLVQSFGAVRDQDHGAGK